MSKAKTKATKAKVQPWIFNARKQVFVGIDYPGGTIVMRYTPAKARELARMLADAADEVEKKGGGR